tara:strand:- start:24 stop:326 length:303 start_codon:yes stop_codon:yes gene_type:complete
LRNLSVDLRQDFEGHFDYKLKEGYLSDFWKDIRGWETLFDSVLRVVNVLFPGYFQYRPTFGTNPYDFSGPKAFRYKVGLETDLNATASEGNFFFGFRNFQ